VIDADTITLGLTVSIPATPWDRRPLLRQLASSKIQRNFNSERAAKPND